MVVLCNLVRSLKKGGNMNYSGMIAVLGLSIAAHAGMLKLSLDQTGIGIGYSGQSMEHMLLVDGSLLQQGKSSTEDSLATEAYGYSASMGYRLVWKALELNQETSLKMGFSALAGYNYNDITMSQYNVIQENRSFSLNPELTLEKQLDQFSIYARIQYKISYKTMGQYYHDSILAKNNQTMGDDYYWVSSIASQPSVGVSYTF